MGDGLRRSAFGGKADIIPACVRVYVWNFVSKDTNLLIEGDYVFGKCRRKYLPGKE